MRLTIPYLAAAAIVLAGALLGRDTASRGQDILEHQCSRCHTLDQDKEGPHLRGVYGRPAASLPNYRYSDALKASKIVWDDQTLDKWLADPGALVPDSYMAFHLGDGGERKAVIAYLKQISGK